MGFRIFSKIVLIAGLAFGLVACGGGGGGGGGGVTPGGSTPPTSPTGATLLYIMVTSASASLPKGLTEQFIATGIYSDGTRQNLTASATWSSSNPAVATIISNSGVATTVAAGTTTITATAGITSLNYPLTVTTAALNFIAITPPSPTIGAGQTTQFKATGTYSDSSTLDITSSVFWSSSNFSIAAVNSTTTTPVGLATGKTPGTAIITATNPSANSISASTTLTVAGYGVSGLLSLLPGGNSVVLQNNSTDNITLNANGTFMFSTPLASGAAYNVSVLTQPTGVVHPCNVVNGSGTIPTTYITSVQVVCATAVGTFAGTANVFGATDGTGTSAQFYSPSSVAVDATGNVYVADTANQLIRKITPAGVVSTLAGTAGMAGSVNGQGTAASFFNPTGIAVDTSGNVYVADSGNNMIRKITPAGVVSTLAGSGLVGSTNSATGTSASFSFPNGLAVDSTGNIYVADTYNNLIRKITPAGAVSTLAGVVGSTIIINGPAATATFSYPSGVAVDAANNVYVADSNSGLIRLISAGQVTTFAGAIMSPSPFDGPVASASFYWPVGVAVDSSGSVYVGDRSSSLIRKISAGYVTTYAGLTHYMGSSTGSAGFHDGPAWIDASILSSAFNRPSGVAVDSSGNVYVADMGNHLIRKIMP